jgi:SAM-dependent methyltransferase
MTPFDQRRTKKAYALQWNRYRIVRPEEDRATFRNRTGLEPADLDQAVVLDAGCGMGRYLRIAAESRARLIVGMDLSQAVKAAHELNASETRLALVQGDLLRPPFEPATFDQIYSLGVIDHTPDPRIAFMALAELLKPGGRIVVWVYPRERPIIEWMMDLQRAISTRLPLEWLVVLCRMSAPLGGLKRRLMSSRSKIVERVGVALHILTIGVSMHPDAEVRVCDTLDWYAPKYLSRHTFDEVASWFAAAGLTDLSDQSRNQVFFHAGQGNGVNIAGRRPPASDQTESATGKHEIHMGRTLGRAETNSNRDDLPRAGSSS